MKDHCFEVTQEMGHEIGAKICITTKKWTMSDEVQKTAIRADGCTKEERAIRQFV